MLCYLRDLEALDRADNIELQFYKDEVKFVFKSNNFEIKNFNLIYFIESLRSKKQLLRHKLTKLNPIMKKLLNV